MKQKKNQRVVISKEMKTETDVVLEALIVKDVDAHHHVTIESEVDDHHLETEV